MIRQRRARGAIQQCNGVEHRTGIPRASQHDGTTYTTCVRGGHDALWKRRFISVVQCGTLVGLCQFFVLHLWAFSLDTRVKARSLRSRCFDVLSRLGRNHDVRLLQLILVAWREHLLLRSFNVLQEMATKMQASVREGMLRGVRTMRRNRDIRIVGDLVGAWRSAVTLRRQAEATKLSDLYTKQLQRRTEACAGVEILPTLVAFRERLQLGVLRVCAQSFTVQVSALMRSVLLAWRRDTEECRATADREELSGWMEAMEQIVENLRRENAELQDSLRGQAHRIAEQLRDGDEALSAQVSVRSERAPQLRDGFSKRGVFTG